MMANAPSLTLAARPARRPHVADRRYMTSRACNAFRCQRLCLVARDFIAL
jgi:hypothetical protein